VIRPILLSILLATAAGAPSIAQPPPPPGGPMHDPDKALARKGADMALLLGLRADQEPALEAMLRVTMPPPPPQGPDREKVSGKGRDVMPLPATNFTEDLARMERDATQRGDADRARLAALRTFYTQLDSAQQQRFEALLRMLHGPIGMGGVPRPGGSQGHGPGPMPPRP